MFLQLLDRRNDVWVLVLDLELKLGHPFSLAMQSFFKLVDVRVYNRDLSPVLAAMVPQVEILLAQRLVLLDLQGDGLWDF